MAWALQKTLGCKSLLLLVDHKPLLGLLSKHEVGEIDNPRLGVLGEKTMRWTFRLEHVAGAKNFGPDALSRYPVQSGTAGTSAYMGGGFPQAPEQDQKWSAEVEEAVIASYTAGKGVRVVSWDHLREAGIADPQYVDHLHKVGTGADDWSGSNAEYKKYREDLIVVDGVVTHKGRVVVPHAMREEVLRALHRAHQGATGMSLRAAETVWWPGMGADISRMREGCVRCKQNAPSQPPAPPTELPVPA